MVIVVRCLSTASVLRALVAGGVILSFLLGSSILVHGQVLLPERFTDWRFSSEPQQSSWAELTFDDSIWSAGVAPLGFGEPQLATITFTPVYGGTVPITTYFRAEFHRAEEALNQPLRLKIRVDDGFIAYLNGQELQRWNVPAGLNTATTLAVKPLSAPEEQLYRQFDVPAALVRQGRNVVAVEVHQVNNRSSDLYLDLCLSGLRQVSSPVWDSGPPRVRTEGEALRVSLLFNSTHRIEASQTIPDGFVDGGREMQIDQWGYAVSDREIVRVDRSRDPTLQRHLQYARSENLTKLNPIDCATRIARFIDGIMTPEEGHDGCTERSEYLASQYESQEVLLAEIPDLCGAGVCRHRAVLFKLMADVAGLQCTLVRGKYGTADIAGGHTWNELLLDNDQKVIVDVMDPEPDFYFPTVGDRRLQHYLTVANSPQYPVEGIHTQP